MPELSLRHTVIGGEIIENDYCVIFDGRKVGRIRQASERIGFQPGWDWTINPPLPIPAWGTGSEADFESAKEAFKRAWENFYGGLTPDDIARWREFDDAAKR